MTNKEYYSTENKSVKEMMEDFSKTGMKSYDEWLNVERISFSDEISFETEDGKIISAEEAYTGTHRIEFVCIKNDILKSQNACFKVRLDDLDIDTEKVQITKWSNNIDLIDDIPLMEDGVISGQKITDILSKNHDLDDFPAFKVCLENCGFLPTLFQFRQLWKHKGEISAIMKNNGWMNPFENENLYWTSSQFSATGAWYWNSSGSWYPNGKTTSYRVLRFYAF